MKLLRLLYREIYSCNVNANMSLSFDHFHFWQFCYLFYSWKLILNRYCVLQNDSAVPTWKCSYTYYTSWNCCFMQVTFLVVFHFHLFMMFYLSIYCPCSFLLGWIEFIVRSSLWSLTSMFHVEPNIDSLMYERLWLMTCRQAVKCGLRNPLTMQWVICADRG